MKYRHLPQRFWVDSDYEDGEERLKKPSFSLKSAAFRKIYNKKISPFLRKRGYKASGTKGTKQDEQFHYEVAFYSGRYGGEGVLSFSIHPKGFPNKDSYRFIGDGHLMGHRLALPNGQTWIQTGRTEEEGQETAQYLLEILEEQLDTLEQCYQQELSPDTLAMTIENLKEKHESFRQKYGLKNYLANYEVATAAHIARFYRLQDNLEQAQQWVDHARALEVEWANSRNESTQLRVQLLLDNIINPDSELYWTDANKKIYWAQG